MANLQHIENHLDLAKDNLLTQDRGKPVLDGLLTAILTPLQEIESKLFELYKQRSIDQATGYYLDGIGEIVGEPRKYRNDDDYRLGIRIAIISNNGGGTSEDILTILNSVYPHSRIRYSQFGHAFFQIHIENKQRPKGIIALLNKLKPVGVSFCVTYAKGECLRCAKSSKAGGDLTLATGTGKQTAKTSNAVNTNIIFGSFEPPENGLGLAELLIHKNDLELMDGETYQIDKTKALETIESRLNYTIKGGGRLAEEITHD